TTVTGTAVVKNAPKDTWTVLTPSSPFITIGEAIHGETTMVLTSALTVNTGITCKGNTSLANGVITLSSSTNLRVKGVTLNNKFQNGETVHFLQANGLPIKSGGVYVTRKLSSVITPTARVEGYDTVTTSNTLLMVANVSVSNTGPMSAGGGVFVPGFQVKGQANGFTATIGTIKNLQGDYVQILTDYLQPANTALNAGLKMATTTSTKDTSSIAVPLNEAVAFTSGTRYVLSRSIEANTSASVGTMVSAKSAEAIFTFSTNSRQVSPAVDVNRLAVLTIENRLTTNAAIGTSEDAVASGGSSLNRYITRTVTLADGQDAQDIRVYLSAYKHTSSQIAVYYKIRHNADSDTFESQRWIPMTQLTAATVLSDKTNTDDIKEYQYGIPSYTNLYKSGANTTNSNIIEYRNSAGARYSTFKYFAIKIVITDDINTANPPRLRDVRVVALQV
ncbi:MAG TPA: hypothetical protein VET48_07090, partial [Steroidobacteraceae bacterium]|nr:hypothetical protein [Steroidobacteraceae bacterium]